MTGFSERDLENIVERGLASARSGAKIVVVGAGMAGLVAGYELLRAGHDPLILEGRERVGGRVQTIREPFAPGLHGEAGAMRIPTAHTLTMGYVRKFRLQVSPFTMPNPKAYCYFNGRKHRIADLASRPESLGFEFAAHERGRSVMQLWDATLEPLRRRLAERGPTVWDEISAEYDAYSTRDFLEANRWSEEAIELFGLLTHQEALMNASVLELLREEVNEYFGDLVQVDGGMDHLPRAFLPVLQSRIRFGARVVALDQAPDSVTVHHRTRAGLTSVQADYAVIAIPLPVLRHVEVLKPFSPGKRRAIRQLPYDAASKIFLQCRRRFWEEDEGIFGGYTVTDLPIRSIFYPEHGRETGRGVLLASYSRSEDARRWGPLTPASQIDQALKNVAEIHSQVSDEFEVGASKIWDRDEFAGGAFAVFNPRQQTLLYEHLVAPEGRIHFAGEHASLAHAWIQGAIESGLRTAAEIHTAAQASLSLAA